MKIFIAGARSITNLDEVVKKRMLSIYQKGFDVLVGDCYGVDTSVQKFYSDLHYNNVTVYASNGKARNNIGCWDICIVPVSSTVKGFDFYKQKDIAMANNADYGFMVWDGKSKGTLNNIFNLISQNKTVLVYFQPAKQMVIVKNFGDLNKLIDVCTAETKYIYFNLLHLSKT